VTDLPEQRRREELAARREKVMRRVAAAAASASRKPEELTVITVAKTFPFSDVLRLNELGVLDIGENRAQELAAKVSELATLPAGAAEPIRWHFIGQLQSNKAALIARECAALHTLDRLSLVAPLQRGAERAGRVLDVFLQLSLDGDPHRGGIGEAEIPALADAVARSGGLRLAGLMAVPPLGAAPRPAFARLRGVSEHLRATHPEASALSAGMSADLEDAVMEGATHLRIGTDLMGSRA
jgi:PLP dependent protein